VCCVCGVCLWCVCVCVCVVGVCGVCVCGVCDSLMSKKDREASCVAVNT
jgi:hypothetical protein